MKFITVDIGSTYIKAGLFDVAARTECEKVKYPTPEKRKHPDNSHYENSADEFLTIIKKIIADYCTRYPDTAGIVFSTQQHGCVISHPDLKDDTYISWQDTRSLKLRPGTDRSYMQELQEMFSREEMAVNGVYIKPALALCNLYTLFEERELSRSPETRIHTLGSYIIEKLTGNGICHITNAAPMGFADVVHTTWRRDMLEKAGLDFIQLPAVTNQMECCGYYRNGDSSIAVFPDAGDVQTSVYGTAAKAGDLVVNIGTSGQIIYVTDKFVPGDYEIRPFYEENYCNVISCMPGGRNFDVQIDYIRDIGEKIFHTSLERGEVWTRIHQMESSEDTEGLEVDCGFYELPDRLADGNIRHMNHMNFTLQNVIQATAVDFGRTYKKFADYLCAGTKERGRVYFIGGALLKNPKLQEAIRREIGVEEVICAQDDEVFGGMEKLVFCCLENMRTERMRTDEAGD